MRIVLADLKGSAGFVSKDTTVGGYGSRLLPFTKVTAVICRLKQWLHDLPSVHLAYAAALAAREGHTVVVSEGELVDGDVAIVLSSLVDYRRETHWASTMRARGVPVGFIGVAASKLPALFEESADFMVMGEPEAALSRLMRGERLRGRVDSPALGNLDELPYPDWRVFPQCRRRLRSKLRMPFAARPSGGTFPLLASRSCPEFCTYCPHRIVAPYRVRSVAGVVDELAELCRWYPKPYVIFRDPLFTQDRARVLEFCDELHRRALSFTFECETRLDRLDPTLLGRLHDVGLRGISFGVESVSPATLRKVGRRPIPEEHQREILKCCRQLGVLTAAFFVIGFLEDDWESVGATIDYAVRLSPTVAYFKILTPYPGTPLFARLQPLLTERDWEKFDGFTPTFAHPNLTHEQLRFLLGAAYTRFYMRPSYLADYLRITTGAVRKVVARLDERVERRHAREEIIQMSRALSC